MRSFAVLCALFALPLSACLPGTGDCDREAAAQLAYDQNGVPAFVGQALVITSCGDGAFCHAPGVAAGDRFGAPAGLDYDVRVVSTTPEPDPERALALRDAQDRILAQHAFIMQQVQDGHMPPRGAAGASYAMGVTSQFRVALGDGTNAPLPSLDDPDAQEELRNWIACGAPLVERTEPRSDAQDNAAGFTVPACDSTCIDLTWPALHAGLIVPGCAGAKCHDGVTAAGGLDLSGDPTVVRDRLLDAPADGLLCRARGGPLLTAGDPSSSLLYLKVAPVDGRVPCGVRMPVSGSALNAQRLCALSAWITCGACADPADAACATCIEEHRASCGVPAGGTMSGECVEQTICDATFTPPPPLAP